MAEAKLPTLKRARQWIGLRLDGVGGRALGRVSGLQLDADDGKPRWVVIRLGPFAGHTAIPFEHVAEGGGRVWAAYERDWVREAPRIEPGDELSANDEMELCLHWGIGQKQGRAAEVAKHGGDQITGVPDEG